MAARILFIQNGPEDQPGLLATVAAEGGYVLEVRHAYRGEEVPLTGADWAGIVVGGGAMSAWEHEAHPWLARTEALLQHARTTGQPVLGLCLGAQLLARAAGAQGCRNTAREIGFHPVHFTSAAHEDPLWQPHAAAAFRPVSWHQDTFSLPPGATLLASSALTPHQLFRLGPAQYGLQFHLEMDAPTLLPMIKGDAEWLRTHGHDPEQFRAAAARELPALEPVARAVFSSWLRAAAG